jgi:hypothetical protein
MSELTPEDDALIRQARNGLEPTSEDHARVRGKVFARVGVGLGAGAATLSAAGATAAAAGGTASALGLKILGTLLVVGCIAGGTLAVRERHEANVPVPRPKVTGSTPFVAPEIITAQPEAPPPAPSVPTPPTPLVPLASQPPQPVVAHVPVVRSPMPPTTAPAMTAPLESPPAAPPQAGPATVAAEARLLRDADVALGSGDAARALALLDEHAATYPHGVLVEERMAERVVVLCALGRTAEAQQAATSFLRDHERSPLAARVRGSCASP